MFKKGNTPWNKGTKGLSKPNSGSFKQGMLPTRLGPEEHLINGERICRKCGERKAIDKFVKDKTCVYGRSYTCKRCFANYALLRYRANYVKKGRVKLTDKQRRDNRKEVCKNYRQKPEVKLKERERVRQHAEQARESISDSYVRAVLNARFGYKSYDITDDMVDLQKEWIKTRRLVRRINKTLKKEI